DGLMPPGRHLAQLRLTYAYNTTTGWSTQQTTVPWPVQVRRPDLSAFGYGWWSAHDTLLVDSGRFVTIMQGDSRQVAFIREGDNLRTPAGEFSTLAQASDGTWTRTYRDGSTMQFNADGRLTRISDRYGNFQLLLYESNGRSVPTGSWDLTTRLRRIVDSSENSFDFVYSDAGYLAEIRDSAGRSYRFEHDEQGFLIATIDPLGQREQFGYDANGGMTSHTDKRGNATRYVLDAQGRLVSRTWPTGSDLTVSYSADQISVTTDRSTPIVTTLDARFNPVARFNGVYTATTTYNDQLLPERSDSPPMTMLYDANGQVIETLAVMTMQIERNAPFDLPSRIITSDGNDTRYAYDTAGNLIAFTDALGQRYTMTYDANGQPLSISDPLGNTTRFSYDSRGQISSVRDPLNRQTNFSYDTAGNLLTSQDALGRTTTMEYDALNRMTSLVDALNGTMALEYDANNNLVSLIDPSGREHGMIYDQLDRLTERNFPDGGSERFAYDPFGNLTSFTDARTVLTTMRYDAANRLIEKAVTDGPTVRYAYDDLNQEMRRNDGQLDTLTSYLENTVGFPLHEQQLANGLPLSVTTEFDYGLGYAPMQFFALQRSDFWGGALEGPQDTAGNPWYAPNFD
ncbi:MAG: RHS repeat protein, partial [Chloroflexia bacterium]|nr:RHS repeat protein [Chloroflexia bacterium]